jgi:hypothetical protein
LWHDHRDGKARDCATRASRLRSAIAHHLRDRTLSDRGNQRLLNELGGHQDRGNLLRFLSDPTIEPTNNRAERALRPAVIGRKVSQCSKTRGGAEAFAAFASVIRTLAKTQGNSLIDALMQVFRPPKPQTARAVPRRRSRDPGGAELDDVLNTALLLSPPSYTGKLGNCLAGFRFSLFRCFRRQNAVELGPRAKFVVSSPLLSEAHHRRPHQEPAEEAGVFCISPRKGIFQALLSHGRRCEGRPAKALGLLGPSNLQALSC